MLEIFYKFSKASLVKLKTFKKLFTSTVLASKSKYTETNIMQIGLGKMIHYQSCSGQQLLWQKSTQQLQPADHISHALFSNE